jgi:hypothetical protein
MKVPFREATQPFYKRDGIQTDEEEVGETGESNGNTHTYKHS